MYDERYIIYKENGKQRRLEDNWDETEVNKHWITYTWRV